MAKPIHANRSGGRVVLVTGAAGNIGSYFAEQSHQRYRLRLMVRDDDEGKALRGFGEIVEGDITDFDRMHALCEGVDTVLHLAAEAGPSTPWSGVLNTNIIGTYNTLVAARKAGCRRVIFASSIHAVSGYPADYQVHADDPPNPGDLYGVSKCFGEALARYLAEQEGMSAICIRIGAFQPVESAQSSKGIEMLDAWVSQRDLNQLIERCIDAEDLQFAIFHGLSDNRFKRMDITNARQVVGFEPQDDLTEVNPELAPLNLDERVKAHNLREGGQKSGLREQTGETRDGDN